MSGADSFEYVVGLSLYTLHCSVEILLAFVQGSGGRDFSLESFVR